MKKYISSSRIVLLVLLSAMAFSMAAQLTVDLTFDLADFDIRTNDAGLLEISSKNLGSCYLDSQDPCLPWIGKSIEVPVGYSNDDFVLTFEKRLIRSDVRMAMRPKEYPTNMLPSEIQSPDNEAFFGSYPAKQCLGSGMSCLKEFDLHHIVVSPFYYDSETSSLYFIDNIALTFKPGKVRDTVRRLRAPAYLNDMDIVKADAEFSRGWRAASKATAEQWRDTDIDYLIVTADSLRDVFEPLIRWKTIKGLRSKIIAVEDIYAEYPGDDLPLKIKQKLFDLYENNNLKYVLLGGDDRIVPVRSCYGQVGTRIDNTIPADIYYACFGGDFEWNANGNDLYGEKADNVDLLQYLHITRMPLRIKSDLNIIINRTIDYERQPIYKHNILMGGVNVMPTCDLWLRSYRWGDFVYSGSIMPYWNGVRHRLYENKSDFSSQGFDTFSKESFCSIYDNGYSFIDIIAHGKKSAGEIAMSCLSISLTLKNCGLIAILS